MRVGRCAPETNLGALRTVASPIMLGTCAGSGDPKGVSQVNPIPLFWDVARCRMRWQICETLAWADYPSPLCARGRCWVSMGGLVMMRSTSDGKACANKAGEMVRASMGRRVSHPSKASRGRRLGCQLCNRASLCAVVVWASGSMSAHV